jgi:hypothetical protein
MVCAACLAALCAIPVAAQQKAPRDRPPAKAASARVSLQPQLGAGLSLRYDFALRLERETQRSGVIEDPHVPGKLEAEASFTVHLEVVSTDPRLALRATCERVTVDSRGALPHLQDDSVARFRQLEGRAFDFTVEPTGELSASAVNQHSDVAAPLLSLLAQLVHGVRAPRQGVTPGQEWFFDGPHGRAQFQYVRNEACYEPGPAGEPRSSIARAGESCALIRTLAQQSAQQREGPGGAVTSASSGEALTWVSLTAGLPIRLAQTFSQSAESEYVRRDDGAILKMRVRTSSSAQITLRKESLVVFP